ncbi:MAG: ferrous iron transport protein A [Bacteroidetes bacterium]|jgi:Fe2+ transport system protein FeoA|nr:ferrous iron transport protein A [Bacteroidota bacterium]
MLLLSDFKPGQTGVLKDIENSRIELRLMSMGIHPGTRVLVRRSTFNSQTFYIQAAGKRLALRKEEASQIEMN